MTPLHPYYDAYAFKGVLLGLLLSPGVVTLSGHNRYLNWEIQKSRGSQGGTTIRGPDPPGQFEGRFDLSDEDQSPLGDLFRWEVFRKLIESTTAGPVPVALPIYHPDLVANGYTEVTNGGIGGAIHSGKGKVSYVVKFLEYRPQKPRIIQPAIPTPAGAAAGGVDPNAQAKAELAALLDEAATL